MRAAYEKFLNDPSRSHYYRLRELLMSGDSRPASMEDLRAVSDAAARHQFVELRRGCEQLMPTWMLSPRVHYLAAVAAEALGDGESWQVEHFQMQQCLSGLLATGTGSLEAPYDCHYPTDMHDILVALGGQLRAQHAVDGPHGCLDLVTCTDGCELWFQSADLAVRTPTPPSQTPASSLLP